MPSFVIGIVFVVGVSAVIFGLTTGVSAAVTAVLGLDNTFKENAKVGPVSIAGLTKNEAMDKIANETNKWYETTKFTFVYKEVKKPIDSQMIVFKVDESVKNAKKNGESPLYIEIQTEYYQSMIHNLNDENLENGLDLLTLENALTTVAINLETGKHTIDLYEYIKEENKGEPTVVAESSVNVGQNQEMIGGWIEHINDYVVEPKTNVSLIQMLKQNGVSPVDSEALDLLAMSIYQTVLKTNFELYERHTSLELPPYADLGYETKINAETMDLVFKNPNHMTYTFQFELVDNQLFTRLIGIPFYYQYTSEVKDKQYFEPKTIIQFDGKYGPAQQLTKEAGKRGMMVNVYRNVNGPLGPIKEELISEDFYPPTHRIVVRGPSVIEKEEPATENEEGTTTETEEKKVDEKDQKTEDTKTEPKKTDDNKNNKSDESDSTKATE